MEFELTSAKYWCDFKRVLDDHPRIVNEFKVQIIDTTLEDERGKRYINSEVYITIDTLEDLIKLTDVIDCGVVFNRREIRICDDYLE